MKPVEIEFLMKDGLSKGVDKSRAGVEQLLDASRRLGEVLSQSGEEGARASDKYNSKLVGLRQGVEKMSASLKASMTFGSSFMRSPAANLSASPLAGTSGSISIKILYIPQALAR